ncbi:FlgN protein [Sodalis glossinidius str. 'morsitans']|uniref:Flagella synthesis protein FlgN n=1 Tax=Sodalis glossinidius (strain morsitans) TaxID=343509 RepID=Q2NR88_SODGM|nr:flagellar export chaperone FlgN [Sodalis glossinidius]BAE75337.1 putative flagella synthesis protein FlgN [Sodalis glossinidius str. 'morsitans']CRL46355.1 FlgN protein [Sodalis glossinidius str. 'morsitans']
MKTLETLLAAMAELLTELEATLAQEQQLLSSGQVNAPLLHRTTETKDEQLSTLQHINHQRQALEQETGLQAPYVNEPVFRAGWKTIVVQTRTLQQRNGLLLDVHLKLNQRGLSSMTEQRSLSRMYDPKGHASAQVLLGPKFSV